MLLGSGRVKPYSVDCSFSGSLALKMAFWTAFDVEMSNRRQIYKQVDKQMYIYICMYVCVFASKISSSHNECYEHRLCFYLSAHMRGNVFSLTVPAHGFRA